MINNIRKFSRVSPLGSRRARRRDDTFDGLDKNLSYSPSSDELWTFDEDERSVRLNGVDIGGLVKEKDEDIGLLHGCSQGLYEYQQFVWSRGGRDRAQFNGVVSALQSKIQGRLACIYDDMTGGIKFEADGEDFWLNDVNVVSVLKLYRLRPTEKARTYLSGLRDKLGLILSRNCNSTRYDGIREQATRLIAEIEFALAHFTPDGACRLLSDGRSD